MTKNNDKIGKTEEEAKNAQKKYAELQMLDKQIKQMQEYLQTFEQQIEEITHVINSLKEFQTLKKGDDLFAPIANGIFIKAKLEDNNQIIINVGSNTIVSKTVEDAIKLLRAQENEVNKYQTDTLTNIDTIMKRIDELQLS